MYLKNTLLINLAFIKQKINNFASDGEPVQLTFW